MSSPKTQRKPAITLVGLRAPRWASKVLAGKMTPEDPGVILCINRVIGLSLYRSVSERVSVEHAFVHSWFVGPIGVPAARLLAVELRHSFAAGVVHHTGRVLEDWLQIHPDVDQVILENGLSIQVQRIARAPIGVDTPADLAEVRRIWQQGCGKYRKSGTYNTQ